MYIHFHNSDEKKIASRRELVDLKNWSPLQEVYDQMPSFGIGA